MIHPEYGSKTIQTKKTKTNEFELEMNPRSSLSPFKNFKIQHADSQNILIMKGAKVILFLSTNKNVPGADLKKPVS